MSAPNLSTLEQEKEHMSDQPPDRTIRARFRAFHDANPHVYDELVELARDLRRRGHDRLAIGMLWEVLRWRRMMHTADPNPAGYKLNDHYRSRYARLIMFREPDLRGCFETRRIRRL